MHKICYPINASDIRSTNLACRYNIHNVEKLLFAMRMYDVLVPGLHENCWSASKRQILRAIIHKLEWDNNIQSRQKSSQVAVLSGVWLSQTMQAPSGLLKESGDQAVPEASHSTVARDYAAVRWWICSHGRTSSETSLNTMCVMYLSARFSMYHYHPCTHWIQNLRLICFILPANELPLAMPTRIVWLEGRPFNFGCLLVQHYGLIW